MSIAAIHGRWVKAPAIAAGIIRSRDSALITGTLLI
jgi:hypothetical protein